MLRARSSGQPQGLTVTHLTIPRLMTLHERWSGAVWSQPSKLVMRSWPLGGVVARLGPYGPR